MRTLCVLPFVALLSAAPAAVAPGDDAQAVELDLTGCAYLESVNTVPGALVDPLVPDDFRVAGTANLVVGMASCDARTKDGRSDRVTFGWADVSVYPPAALRRPEGGLHLYRIEHLATDDLYGELHAALGAACRRVADAEVEVSLGDAHASASDGGALPVWDIRAAATPATGGGGATPYREFGPAVGGYAYLDGTLTNPGATPVPGVFRADATSPLFTLWGPAWASPMLAAQGFGIVGTEIGFLPWDDAPVPTETC